MLIREGSCPSNHGAVIGCVLEWNYVEFGVMLQLRLLLAWLGAAYSLLRRL